MYRFVVRRRRTFLRKQRWYWVFTYGSKDVFGSTEAYANIEDCLDWPKRIQSMMEQLGHDVPIIGPNHPSFGRM
jgi:hypothetical protein